MTNLVDNPLGQQSQGRDHLHAQAIITTAFVSEYYANLIVHQREKTGG